MTWRWYYCSLMNDPTLCYPCAALLNHFFLYNLLDQHHADWYSIKYEWKCLELYWRAWIQSNIYAYFTKEVKFLYNVNFPHYLGSSSYSQRIKEWEHAQLIKKKLLKIDLLFQFKAYRHVQKTTMPFIFTHTN